MNLWSTGGPDQGLVGEAGQKPTTDHKPKCQTGQFWDIQEIGSGLIKQQELSEATHPPDGADRPRARET